MMWYWSNGVHWWGWLLGFVGMVAFWGLIVWVLWYFITGVTRAADRPSERPPMTERPGATAPQAKHILDERLARGEIDAEEYRRLRDLITGADRAPAQSGAGSGPGADSGGPA